MSDNLSSLDEIFAQAKTHILAERKAKAKAVVRHVNETPDKITTQALFLEPENWTRKRGVALIHEDTETVLGNFSEYVHRTVPGCRKLVREEAPISVSATERVSGSWWLGAERRPEPRKSWHEQRRAILHLHLALLKVHSPLCEVTVHLSYGSIARVELAEDTQFAAEDGEAEQLLFLPAKTNVLEVMAYDSKQRLWQEIKG